MEFVFIIEFIPNFLNISIIFKNIFGVFFQVQIIWYKVFWKVKMEARRHNEKNYKFQFIWDDRRRLEVLIWFLFY
jgi:hypothetical protein